MLNIMLKYSRNRVILLWAYLIYPAIFITIGNLNIWFLSVITFCLNFIIIFDDLKITIGLPISRSDIVKGNYIAYFILSIINLSYLFSLIYLVSKYLPYEADKSFSLIGLLHSINILAIYSLVIPLSVRNKLSQNYRWVNFYPAIGYLVMIPLMIYIDKLQNIKLIYHLIFTIGLTPSLFIYGYRNSLKNIELIDL